MITGTGFVVGVAGIAAVLWAMSVNGFLGLLVAIALIGLAAMIEAHS